APFFELYIAAKPFMGNLFLRRLPYNSDRHLRMAIMSGANASPTGRSRQGNKEQRKMRLKIFVAGLMLAVFTTSASAEQNLLEKVFNPTSDQSFVQKFLDRYRPSATVDATAVSNQMPEPAIQQRIREGSLPISVADIIRFMVESNLDVKLERFSPLTQQLFI